MVVELQLGDVLGPRTAQIHLACLQLLGEHRLVGHDLADERLQVGRALPVGGVSHHSDVVVFHPLVEKEGPDAHCGVGVEVVAVDGGETLGEYVLGQDAQAQIVKDGALRLLELEDHGVIVGGLDGLHEGHVVQAWRLDLAAHESLEGEKHILGVEVLTVGPFQALAQVEGEGQAVIGDLPALGQVTGDVSPGQVVGVYHAAEDAANGPERGTVRGQDGVQVLGVGEGTNDQHATFWHGRRSRRDDHLDDLLDLFLDDLGDDLLDLDLLLLLDDHRLHDRLLDDLLFGDDDGLDDRLLDDLLDLDHLGGSSTTAGCQQPQGYEADRQQQQILLHLPLLWDLCHFVAWSCGLFVVWSRGHGWLCDTAI